LVKVKVQTKARGARTKRAMLGLARGRDWGYGLALDQNGGERKNEKGDWRGEQGKRKKKKKRSTS